MNFRSRSLFSAAVALLLAFVAGCGSGDDAPPPPAATSYLPVGPQINVAASTVTAGGWTVCFTDLYNDSSAVITTVLATCNKARLMLACRQVGLPDYSVLAQAPRADVTFVTPADATTSHNANGTAWYFNDDWSWGFARQGDTLNKDNCDIETNGANDERLCWHTGAGSIVNGWRCGAITGINDGSTERQILHAD